jgi:hypothetical protein
MEDSLHPTGMSIDRCIEALSSLDADLDRVLRNSGSQSPKDQRDELEDLIRDLTLDVDLRTSTVSTALMTDVETDVYLPAIEKILALLADDSPQFSDQSARREAARELTKMALMRANALKV